nr:hypothetical protein CFP56_63792 [Quercus suber]
MQVTFVITFGTSLFIDRSASCVIGCAGHRYAVSPSASTIRSSCHVKPSHRKLRHLAVRCSCESHQDHLKRAEVPRRDIVPCSEHGLQYIGVYEHPGNHLHRIGIAQAKQDPFRKQVNRVRTSAPAVLAFATTVLAVNQPPPVPQNAQIGKLNFPVTCAVYGFINQTFEAVFTATAPVFGGSGQEIYYTDVVGTIDIPSSITSLGVLVSATQAQANVTANLKLTNASPANLEVYKATLNNVPFTFGQDATIRIPPGSGTLPPLGPVTLGTANEAHRIFLGQVDVSIELMDKTGKNVLGPIPVSCGQQNIDFVIGSVNVDSSSGPALAPAVGFVPDFPPTPATYESGAFRFPYNCDFGALGPQNLDLTIGGEIATYFAPGQKFSLTYADSFLRIPASLVSLAKSAFPNLKSFDTTITSFDILFTNASPSSFNAAANPIKSSIDVAGASSSEDFVIAIPQTGYLPDVGPITAGSAGTIAGIAIGQANATVVLVDTSGNSLLTLPVTCNVPAPLELIGARSMSVRMMTATRRANIEHPRSRRISSRRCAIVTNSDETINSQASDSGVALRHTDAGTLDSTDDNDTLLLIFHTSLSPSALSCLSASTPTFRPSSSSSPTQFHQQLRSSRQHRRASSHSHSTHASQLITRAEPTSSDLYGEVTLSILITQSSR